MTDRHRLANRRPAETISVRFGQNTIHATFGLFPNGRPGDVFITGPKVGSGQTTSNIEAAIAVSFALQYGAPIEDLRAAMPRDEAGQAQGVIGAVLDAWHATVETKEFA